MKIINCYFLATWGQNHNENIEDVKTTRFVGFKNNKTYILINKKIHYIIDNKPNNIIISLCVN